jgi:hypothetical protein
MSKIELPEVFSQTQPKEDVSDKYQMINTEDVLHRLSNIGFELEGIQVAGVRKESNRDKQKHLATMKYKDMETPEGVPTIVIQNSHNRSSGFNIHTGFIRFACMNGLIAGSNIESLKVKHTNQEWDYLFGNFIYQYMDNVQKMQEEHRRLASKVWNSVKLRYFLEEASKIRYNIEDVMDINELNLVRRIEDRGNDGYKIYNRVQEALTQGLFTRRTKRTTEDGVTIDNWSQAKKLTDQREIIRVNKEVRELALEVM